MSRRNVKHYAGASGRILPEKAAKLGSNWMAMEKKDGAYCHLHLDRAGCIARVTSRTGRDFGSEAAGLLGRFAGWPNAVLAGEGMWHSPAGISASKAFGARHVWLFDMVYGYGGEFIGDQTYAARRDALCRMQAQVKTYEPKRWIQTTDGIRGRWSRKFTKPIHRGVDLTPIIPMFKPSKMAEHWDKVKAGKWEGLVFANMDAPVGRKGSRKKLKNTTSIDALVVSRGKKTARCLYMGKQFFVNIGRRDVCVGDVWSVKHDQFYPDGTPKFARFDRHRTDLEDRGIL